MTIDEQDAAILRLVKSRSEAKLRKTVLEAELRSAGESLTDIGGSLRHVGGFGKVDPIIELIDKAPTICGLDSIRAMTAELLDLNEKIRQFDQSISALGIVG